MNYIEVKLNVSDDFADIFMAEMGELGYETFTEEDYGLNAYIIEEQYSAEAMNALLAQYSEMCKATFEASVVEKKNWNEEWEKNYEPIDVEGKVRVRASFHEPDARFEHEIVINPKMSFGTGHHETTWMVLNFQQEIEQKDKNVLDVGCGTGILAIMAAKLGAKHVAGFDIEDWAVENSIENSQLNDVKIDFRLGAIEDEPAFKYDVVLANINRNILIRDISQYVKFMAEKCTLVVSGFYVQDVEDILKVSNENGLKLHSQKERNNWASIRFEK